MKHASTSNRTRHFAPLLESESTQAALMNLKPGETSGDFGNEHPRAEQWLYVIFGSGAVRYGKQRRAIKEGSLIAIPRGEAHQVINTSKRGVLSTLNFYMPPAYTMSGDVKKTVK